MWGSRKEQDALRRDFTVNALYYNPASREIVDYANGVADLQAKQLVMIGDPEQRYREDPVRMLRCALAAQLGLTIEDNAQAPIASLASLLQKRAGGAAVRRNAQAAVLRHAWECLNQLRQQGLHPRLLPLLDVIVEQPLGEKFVMLAPIARRAYPCHDKPVSVGFLFASLLWHEVLAAWKDSGAGRKPAASLVPGDGPGDRCAGRKLAIPRRYSVTMKGKSGRCSRASNSAAAPPFRCWNSRVSVPVSIF